MPAQGKAVLHLYLNRGDYLWVVAVGGDAARDFRLLGALAIGAGEETVRLEAKRAGSGPTNAGNPTPVRCPLLCPSNSSAFYVRARPPQSISSPLG